MDTTKAQAEADTSSRRILSHEKAWEPFSQKACIYEDEFGNFIFPPFPHILNAFTGFAS